MELEGIFSYIKKVYAAKPEYLWKDDSNSAVFRNRKNDKWFGIIMKISRDKLGLEGKEEIDILNVKLKPDMVTHLQTMDGYYPAYHMNKEHWITILLNGSVPETKILDAIDWSYDLVDGK
ncbi:MAG: MmcQ/YjbR family DNA-binding protein [Eubacteriales bacterium]|nr:MmcQ/YjbR family DNA-binding protein [Eubacteriales bacterium]